MPADDLSPDDVPPAERGLADLAAAAVRALLVQHEAQAARQQRGMAEHNAECEAAQVVAAAQHSAAMQAFLAAFVGPPLPRGFWARQERERRRRADMRALLKRMRE